MKRLNEELGVPKSIIESSRKLYDLLMNKLEKFRGKTINDSAELDLIINDDFKINELVIKKIYLTLDMTFGDVDKVTYTGGFFSPQLKYDTRDKFISVNITNPSEVRMGINFELPKGVEVNFNEIYDILNEDNSKIVDTISHEFKHSYDKYKKPVQSLKKNIDYIGFSNFDGFGLYPIKKFFILLYLSSLTEILVKPTEFASRMGYNKVKKVNFLEFMLNDKTFEEFMVLKNYSIDELYNDMLKYKSTLIELLDYINYPIPNTDDEIINIVLNLAYVNFINFKMDKLIELFKHNTSIEDLFNISSDKNKKEYLTKIFDEYKKYKDTPNKFYETEIKKFNRVGLKMIKKISKLYDMAQDDGDDLSPTIRKIYIKSNT